MGGSSSATTGSLPLMGSIQIILSPQRRTWVHNIANTDLHCVVFRWQTMSTYGLTSCWQALKLHRIEANEQAN